MKKSFRMLHIFIPLSLFFGLIITLIGSFYFAYGGINSVINNFSNKLNIVVYFDRRVSSDYVEKISSSIQVRTDVLKVENISPEQALNTFKERHKDEPLVLQGLSETGTNPFGSSLIVYAKDTSFYQKINDDILAINDNYKNESVKPIEEVTYENHKIAIDTYTKMLKKGEVILSITMILISIFLLVVVYLTLRFATQGDKDEMKVMKLFGAPTMLMMGPTSVMGIVSGLIGAIIALFALYFLAQQLTPYTMSLSSFNLSLWYIDHIREYILGTTAFGIIVGFLGSLFAIRRYL
jgi:cell division transport system permease protein